MNETKVALRWALGGLLLALALIAWSILTMRHRGGTVRREPPAIAREAPALKPSELQGAPSRTRLGPVPPSRAIAVPWALPETTHPPLLAPWQKRAASSPPRAAPASPLGARDSAQQNEDDNDAAAGLIWLIPALGNTPYEGNAFND